MENIGQLDTIKKTLDLREWRKHIDKKDAEYIINNEDKWNYWWFNEGKTRITTLKEWKLTNYKTSETEILYVKTSDKNCDIEQKVKSEVLTDLFLSPDCKVRNTAEAYEKAKYSDKSIFWFISKGKWDSVIVLDFSQWKKPKRTVYPLNKYNLKMKVIKI